MATPIAAARKYLDRANQGGMARVLARGTSLAFIVFAVGHVVNFVTQIVLARQLGRSDFGVYSYVLSWLFLMKVLTGIGLDTSMLRFVPAYRTNREWELMHGFVRRAYEWTLLITIGTALASSLIVLAVTRFDPGTQAFVFLVGVWMLPAIAILDLQTSLARSLRRVLLAYTPKRVLRYVAVLVGIGVMVVVGINVTSWTVMAMTGLTLTGIVAVQFLMIRRNMYPEALEAPARFEDRSWLRVSLPLLGVSLTQEVMLRTDVLMIGSFLSSDDVAVYSVATRVATMVTFVLSAVNSMAAPMISQYYARGDTRQMQRLVSMIAHITFWPSLAIAVGMAVFAEPLLGLFGRGFDDGKMLMIILLGGQLVNAGAGSVGYILNMTGHERDALRVYATSAVFNIVAVFIGVQFWGVYGAAVATALTVALWNIWLHTLSVRYLKVYPSVLSLAWLRRGRGAAGSASSDE